MRSLPSIDPYSWRVFISELFAFYLSTIHAQIIGGLHLAGPEFESRLTPTVEFLSQQLRPAPMYVLPMHCSGFRTKVALEAALGEGCVPAGVGHRVHIVGNEDDEVKLFSPTY